MPGVSPTDYSESQMENSNPMQAGLPWPIPFWDKRLHHPPGTDPCGANLLAEGNGNVKFIWQKEVINISHHYRTSYRNENWNSYECFLFRSEYICMYINYFSFPLSFPHHLI